MSADQPSLIRANATLVHYPRFNELHADIRLCQEVSRIAGEPQCMVLEGVTGAGKSTLVRTYTEMFSRYETTQGTRIPVFYMETPSPVTVKGMAARMLETLGDPAAHQGALWAMNSRLIHYIRACQVQLVILDDFHHLIDQETNRILETVSDWLKVLIKETGIPFLVVGLAGKVELILQTNAQLSRLFAIRESLMPFSWDPHDEALVKEFAYFIKYTEKGIGISLSDELPRAELLHRLHYATNGVVGNIMNLLRFATLLSQPPAEATTNPVLTLLLLSRAFTKRLRQHLPHKIDPFLVDPSCHFVAPASTQMDPLHSTGLRSKRRKQREASVADVLSAS